MAFSAPYTFTALELLTAAKMNAIQANISAIWVGTTAGDVDYYTSSTGKTRLAIGTAYQFLQVNAGATAPAWGGLHFASVYHNTTQTLTNGVSDLVAFNAEDSDLQGWHDPVTNNTRVTVGVTGLYQMSFNGEYTAAGGTGEYWDTVEFYRSGTVVAKDRRFQNIDAFNKMFCITSPILPVTAGQYLEVAIEQNSGGNRTLQANARFSVLRVA